MIGEKTIAFASPKKKEMMPQPHIEKNSNLAAAVEEKRYDLICRPKGKNPIGL